MYIPTLRLLTHALIILTCCSLTAVRASEATLPLVDAGAPYGKLPLVEEILLSEVGENLVELPAGASRVETILGKPVRVLPTQAEASYLGIRLGVGKQLSAGKAYLLTVDFPDDAPRSFTVANRGSDIRRGVFTGTAVGDVIYTFTNNNIESLQIPHSQQMLNYQQLFWLNEKYFGLESGRKKNERPERPENGFLVVLSQPESVNAPHSQGLAAWRIRLFEVPDVDALKAELPLPPEELPRRYVFYREEAADQILNKEVPANSAFVDINDYYRHQIKRMGFLGIDTFCKDLLEFGSVQNWDAGENNNWFWNAKYPGQWKELLTMAGEHGLTVIPMYEYGGSIGKDGYGSKKLAEPLKGPGDFTHIKWSESKRLDITDPLAYEDCKKLLDKTIIRHKELAKFVGAWLRPRVGNVPISFADATRERFAAEANDGIAVSRADLQADKALLDRYYSWWFVKRRDFIVAMRDHLRSHGIDGGVLLYGTYTSEPGPNLRVPGKGVVTDQLAHWQELAKQPGHEKSYPISYEEVVKGDHNLRSLTDFPSTWGEWEVHHGNPPADPANFKELEGAMLTYDYNKLYSVSTPSALEAFRNKGGLAMMHFWSINEHSRQHKTGYFMSDYDRAGPYSMLPEARAVAYGDPWYMGYMTGHIFTRSFPEYARRFNQNYLALPALPSRTLAEASEQEAVVVRIIETEEHGHYYAVVNTGLTTTTAKLQLPGNGAVKKIVGKETLKRAEDGSLSLALYPGQLVSLHQAK